MKFSSANSRSRRQFCILAALLAALPALNARQVLSQENSKEKNKPQQAATSDTSDLLAKGKKIYAAQCASCHGKNGEGVEEFYPDALVGDSSIGELSGVVADTMPEEDPDQCVGEDASAVAAYIHHAFYSKAAQLRNRPPRVGLARLTSSQLRQSLADLYQHFEGVSDVTDKRGVEAQYFNGARWKRENMKIERIDPVIDFDFGDDGPGSDIDAKDFLIHWEGGILADVSGQYEIVLRSTCSCVMDFGASDRRLVDNHVQSGDKTEFRRYVTLTAGRIYPFDINFEQRKRKTKQPPAKISLSWVPPNGVETVIPTRNLVQTWVPSTFSLQTKLPPDDRSYGYERGISIDPQWDESTTAAALEFANIAIEELWPRYLRNKRKEKGSDRDKLKQFLVEVVQTAFRGSLDDDSRKIYIDKQLDATKDDAEAIKRAILISLKSPRFLYPLADANQSASQRAANRLALTMFDSLPSDKWLIERAEKNQLKSEDEVRRAAQRMLNDWRTRGKTLDMLHQWLNLSHIQDMSKNQEKFPGFDDNIVADLHASLDTLLNEIVWSDSSDYRQLFLADWSYTTDRLATFYGDRYKPAKQELNDANTPGVRRTANSSQQHLGVLTHPLLMSGLAYNSDTSPIHRGVFLIRFVLGRNLRPPNAAFAPLSPDLHPDLTTRERVSLQTSAESCQICHQKINALGFSLENFDAVGKFRENEMGKQVDASGSYMQQSGKEVSFNGARELANYLAESRDAQEAFINRAFQHMVKQPVAAYGPESMNRLMTKFESSEYNIKELLVEIAVIAATQNEQ